MSSTATSAARCPEAALTRVEQHVREPRLQRQRGDGAAVARLHGLPHRARRAIDRRSRASSTAAAGGGSRKGRRAGRPRPTAGKSSSRPREVGFEDFRRVMRRQRRVAASSHRRMATPGACRAARPARWVDRGPAGALGDQSGEAGAAIVARAAGEAAVDDDADVLERDAGLGDAGREHELALARRRRRERRALRCGSMPPCSLWSSTSARESIQALGGALDLGDAGQEGEQRARHAPPSAARIADAICGSMPRSRVAADVRISSGKLLPSLSIVGAFAEQALEARDVERRRHRDRTRRSGRNALAHRARARARDHCRGCARALRRTAPPRRRRAPGSAWIRERNTPWVMTMTRVAFADLAVEPRRIADRLARPSPAAPRP